MVSREPSMRALNRGCEVDIQRLSGRDGRIQYSADDRAFPAELAPSAPDRETGRFGGVSLGRRRQAAAAENRERLRRLAADSAPEPAHIVKRCVTDASWRPT